jgi:hypothetical protein
LTRKAVEGITRCERCRKYGNEKSKRQFAEGRLKVISLYDGKCACCGLENPKYLELDHKNNDGKKEREKMPGIRGGRFILWVWTQWILTGEKREDLQVLCANCHVAKLRGGCKPEDHVWIKPNPLSENSSFTVESWV